MHAEIIAVGTELTTGASLDTNSQWLSLELAGLGIPVQFHTTVADDLEAMVGVLRTAIERADVVLVTGGLGPTLDDLTRQALAAVMGTELILDEPSLELIRALFARHRRDMPERNRIQAHFPAGSAPISNPLGTAPGIWVELVRPDGPACRLAAMPGVPTEMKRMFLREVAPRLAGSNRIIRRARVNCFGVGESMAEEMLGELTARGRDPEVGITVHEATITLRIVAQGLSEDECEAKILATKEEIRQRMGEMIFGEEDEELQHVVVRMLMSRRLTLATAEAGTGGLLAARLTEAPGYELCFRGGLIGVDESWSSLTAVSERQDSAAGPPPTVESAADHAHREFAAVAENLRTRLGADYLIAVGPFPHYDPEDAAAIAPKSLIALGGKGVSRVVDYTFLGDARLNKTRAAKVALNLLRLHLVRSGEA